MKLNLTLPHLIMPPLLHMKLSYLLLGKKGFNLLDDDGFTITYIIDTVTNSPGSFQLKTEYNKNVSIITINGEETITEKRALN